MHTFQMQPQTYHTQVRTFEHLGTTNRKSGSDCSLVSAATRRRSRIADLKECSVSKNLTKGRNIHADVVECGDDRNIYVASTLVDMYAKCGSMVDARGVFDKMEIRNVVSWTALIMGYAENGEEELSIELLKCMKFDNCVPNARTFVAALKACTNFALKEEGKEIDGRLLKIGGLQRGKAIHIRAAQCGFSLDRFVANTLVDMYAKCGSMFEAREVFDGMLNHDLVSLNALMLGYVENGQGELALQLFAKVEVPNTRIYVSALKACSSLAAAEDDTGVQGKLMRVACLRKGKAIHVQAAHDKIDLDTFVANGLIDMYAKCGSMTDARDLFTKTKRDNVVSWNALMLGYATNGDSKDALELFELMQAEGCRPDSRTFVAALMACSNLSAEEEGEELHGKIVKTSCLQKGIAIHSQAAKCGLISDIFLASSLISMYATCGNMVDARAVFDSMPRHDVVSWNALMQGYAENGEGPEAVQVYSRMKSENCTTPNAGTLISALMACGSVAAMETGEAIYAELSSCTYGIRNSCIANCLIDFYGKCGNMITAHQVFDSFVKRGIVSWSTLIAGYSRQGDTKQVLHLFERMRDEGLQANGITFVSILNACSHAGLVDEGKTYFRIMCEEYGVTPTIEHYNCMIGLLGRANQLDDAVAMVNSMPFRPSPVTWMTLLGSCQKWRNVKVGKLAFQSLLKLNVKEVATYMLMANIYGSVGMWEERAFVQTMGKRAGACRKPTKCWWTDPAGVVHTFVAGDNIHTQSKEINAKLNEIMIRMTENGYVRSLCREDEDALCGHCTMLAIAYALMNTAPRKQIRIVNNFQICDDCHKTAAFISEMDQREIICRDASRLHVFRDGKCSCGVTNIRRQSE